MTKTYNKKVTVRALQEKKPVVKKKLTVAQRWGKKGYEFYSGSLSIAIQGEKYEENCFSWEIEEYEFCCGMCEIGNISCDNINIFVDNTALTIDSLAIALKKLVGEYTNSSNTRRIGLSCTLPSDDATYDIFAAALEKAGFKFVGSFINRNSGNELNHYILI